MDSNLRPLRSRLLSHLPLSHSRRLGLSTPKESNLRSLRSRLLLSLSRKLVSKLPKHSRRLGFS